MNRRLFISIIFLMTISLLGIILVQLFWIKNAFEVKEEQFNKSVNEAMVNAVERIETDKNVLHITSLIKDEQAGEPVLYVSSCDSVSVIDCISDNNIDSEIIIDDDSTQTIYIDKNDNTTITLKTVNNERINLKAIIELDSLRDKIHENKQYILSKIEDSINFIVKSKLIELDENTEILDDVLDQMIVEIENINEPNLNKDNIEINLKQSFVDKGIDLPFEYAVYNPESDSTPQIKSVDFTKNDLSTEYKTRLYPDKIFKKPDLLMVSFAGKKTHIFRSLALLLTGSGLFTLIIIITFFITIIIILKQKKLSAIKSDFINNMTHEFKTPIATVSLAVDSINNSKVINNPDQIKYYTSIIDEENKRMNSRVESVLQMSMIDKADFDFRLEEVDLHDVILQATKNVELLLKNKQGVIKFKPQAENFTLNSDKSHILNIITNLLDNAIKYSYEIPKIEIETTNNEKGISIKIEDNGIGMSKDELRKIFDKFYRIPKGDIHNVKGFGLGLSYVKAVVFALGGEINVKSYKDKGSTFILFLPFNKNL